MVAETLSARTPCTVAPPAPRCPKLCCYIPLPHFTAVRVLAAIIHSFSRPLDFDARVHAIHTATPFLRTTPSFTTHLSISTFHYHMVTDIRVKNIVLARAPTRYRLGNTADRCLNVGARKGRHTYALSFGRSNRESVGIVWEIVSL